MAHRNEHTKFDKKIQVFMKNLTDKKRLELLKNHVLFPGFAVITSTKKIRYILLSKKIQLKDTDDTTQILLGTSSNSANPASVTTDYVSVDCCLSALTLVLKSQAPKCFSMGAAFNAASCKQLEPFLSNKDDKHVLISFPVACPITTWSRPVGSPSSPAGDPTFRQPPSTMGPH